MGNAKHYVILGFGLTGRAVLDFILRSHDMKPCGLIITIYDEKYQLKHEDFQNYLKKSKTKFDLEKNNNIKVDFCDNLDYCKNFINEIDAVITSPGINPKLYNSIFIDSCNKKPPVISDIQLFIDNLNNNSKILAITGTNGKSTVCELTSYLLNNNSKIKNKTLLGGNFGIPVLNLLNNNFILPDAEVNYVLELSSFQLALTNYLPCLAAVCLNISPDHLYWHGDMQTYIADKLRIYKNSCFDILNFDQKLVFNYYKDYILPQKLLEDSEPKLIIYSMEKKCNLLKAELNRELGADNEILSKILWLLTISQDYIYLNQEKLLSISKLPEALKSEHNISNFLAVLGILLSIIIDSENIEAPKKIKEALNNYLENIYNFKGLPYRCELIAEFNNIRVYNDSKATNLDACITAIKSIKKFTTGRIWLILGGIAKEDLDDEASKMLFRQNLDHKIAGVIIFGKDERSKQKLLALIPKEINNFILNSVDGLSGLEEVVHKVYSMANISDTILFSPACASFDMFDNYMHRGELFSRAVLKYIRTAQALA